MDRLVNTSARAILGFKDRNLLMKVLNSPELIEARRLNNVSSYGYGITENNDTIPLSQLNATPKIMFANENGNGLFVSGLTQNINEVNNWLSKYPSYPIMVDNGRYSTYMNGTPNLAVYAGLNSPKNMFIVGTKKKYNGGRVYLDEVRPQAKSGIHINPANKGKFTATMKRTGKTAEELKHSNNPLTRKRAIFALNARKWHHG